jgi:uncharacterized protein YodC (DUF2158 family)
MADVAAGDTVKLKSGGPLMTVEKVAKSAKGEILAWCIWFEGTKKLDGQFPPAILEKVGE